MMTARLVLVIVLIVAFYAGEWMYLRRQWRARDRELQLNRKRKL